MVERSRIQLPSLDARAPTFSDSYELKDSFLTEFFSFNFSFSLCLKHGHEHGCQVVVLSVHG